MKKTLPATICLLYLTASLLYIVPNVVPKTHAFQSTSINFKLDGEFGSFGGSKSSASYNLTDTGGGFAIGFGSSANYGTGSGFQYLIAEVREITFTISTSSVNLGALSPSSVSTQSHTIEVTTNGAGGYQVTVVEDGELRNGSYTIDDVSDGTVDTSGNDEEYGLATSKSGQDITQDTSCGPDPDSASAVTASPQTVASDSVPVDADSTTLCYSAVIKDTTEPGSYSHVLTYIATGTF